MNREELGVLSSERKQVQGSRFKVRSETVGRREFGGGSENRFKVQGLRFEAKQLGEGSSERT